MNGYLIKYALKTLKISQEKLAKQLKVSKATIAQWKNDKTDIPFEQNISILKLLGTNDYGGYGSSQIIPLCGSEENASAYRKIVEQAAEVCYEEYEGMWTKESFLGFFGPDYTLFPILQSLYKYKCPIPDGREFYSKICKDKLGHDDGLNALFDLLTEFTKVQVWCNLILDNLPIDFVDTEGFEYLFADFAVSKLLSQLNSTLDDENRKTEPGAAKEYLIAYIDNIIAQHHKLGFGIPYDLFQLLSDDPFFLEKASTYKQPEGMDRYITWGERKILLKLWEAELARFEISGYGSMPELPF